MTRSDPHAEDYLALGFRNVDAAAVDKMAHSLAYMDALPSFQQYKTAILEFMKLGRGSATADLGCGLGFDLRRLSALVGPAGRAIGLDSSLALIKSARSASQSFPAIEFVQADIHSLPLANGVLDSCKIDRTLQHVERPNAVLGEIYRILRPRGTVVCADPDWGTFAIEGVHDAIAQQLTDAWSEGIRNPRMGRELKQRLEDAGFVDLQSQEAVLSTETFESSDVVFDLTQGAARLARNSGSKEPLAWLQNLREAENPVCCSVTLVINFAKKP
jgi:ubiquinone/menaquinone biosynthesis C-methylase UbiE